MTGNTAWESPGGLLNGSPPPPFSSTTSNLSPRVAGFDWTSLPPGSKIVDVGGGIGSTSMLLAEAFSHRKFEFVVQDRACVVDMGVKVRYFYCVDG